jgi:hypothetical protein
MLPCEHGPWHLECLKESCRFGGSICALCRLKLTPDEIYVIMHGPGSPYDGPGPGGRDGGGGSGNVDAKDKRSLAAKLQLSPFLRTHNIILMSLVGKRVGAKDHRSLAAKLQLSHFLCTHNKTT